MDSARYYAVAARLSSHCHQQTNNTPHRTHPSHTCQVGLRGINGLYLFEVDRADGSKVKAADHDTVLEKGDVLWFAGRRWEVVC